MTWLAWRQSRAQTLAALVLLAAVVALLVVTEQHVAHIGDLASLSTNYQKLRLIGTGLIGTPAVIGAFWGAPLVARELEAGSHRLAWTQGVSRSRWFLTKVAVVCAVAATFVAVFSLTFTWWSARFDQTGNRIGTANFGQRGVAPIGYVVFAIALGAGLGTIVRRTLPAMFGTLVGFMGARFAVQALVRPHLIGAAVDARRPIQFVARSFSAPAAHGLWAIDGKAADASGRLATSDAISRSCHPAPTTTVNQLMGCARSHGFSSIVRVHPASQFWLAQSLETVLFVGLAALLAAGTVWWLRHRI